jgi:hypothetical protein
LALSIFGENGTGYVSQYLFSVLNLRKAHQVKHVFGISTRFQQDNRPSARSEILVACPEGWDHTTGTLRMEINSEMFNKEDLQLKGLLSWLTGINSRYIKMPMTPNRFYKDRKTEEFVNIHFYSACYLSVKGETEKAIRNLYQAYLHGFNNIKLLETEIRKGGALHPIINSTIKTAPGEAGENTMPVLSISEIIKEIKNRATHMAKLTQFYP